MAILIDEKTQVVIQGITGRQAMMNTSYMLEYGTKVVAGVTPGKGGEEVSGIPVYNTVKEAKERHPEINTTAIYVPNRLAKEAAFEAMDAGIRLVLVIPERVPQQDMLEVIEYAKERGSVVIGPNSPGLVSPGKALLGMIGARVSLAREFFKEGPAGVLSRSGGNTTTLCYYLTKAGVGQSTAIGGGGDAFVGSTWADLLPYFEKDKQTKMVVAFGEIGTTTEEDAAELIKKGKFTKPFIAYISGKFAKEGMRFGHAGAIITGGKGTTLSKIETLREAGAIVVNHFGEIGEVAKEVLENLNKTTVERRDEN